ncbi:hypothetical protein COJ85_06490 [Bacillus sp. AFS076308]|uniref:DUF4153 domain-containing protein n=1 Tax=unclassified Bacillus (in: firmicutes) TaxID=185979 RepID=UPI000BF4A120|nr:MULTISPECIES: DUF4173 domain-containing protein [unclassified Bacillus (in: firmicutes)]PFO06895.1 hypothetical protein COJ85_06490 [Bacillus sp. AFS076308]PGV55269.1 hypothetical protein COD92_02575 [Bacillus sp. AFS037270]
MEINVNKKDWLFLGLCLLLGILAEESFFRGLIGISYLVFIMAFYAVFFWRCRTISFAHQRFGYLVVICIWLLSAGYVLNENILFYILNIIGIPALVIFHLVAVTSPKNFRWNQFAFIPYIFSRLLNAIKYNIAFTASLGKLAKRGADDNKLIVWKKILIGVVISLPVLAVVLRLLTTADRQFALMVGGIPDLFRIVDAEGVMRIIVVFICMAAFFGLMQVLYIKQMKVIKLQDWQASVKLDTVISVTVLVLINLVYILFTIVQFRYFFSGSLQGDYTYAEYARKGFFELLFVTLINLSITIVVLSLGESGKNGVKRLRQVLLTILVLSSGVLLTSAFIRLSMYEEAYGFTFTRVLSHSFMIFLVVIFTYTLVKIWVEKLSLFHFYFITALIYYTTINVIDLDRIVVKENITRYEETGKIDANYLGSLSATGVLGLIELYERGENIPHLKTILRDKQKEVRAESHTWQSYNLKRERASQKLNNLQFK